GSVVGDVADLVGGLAGHQVAVVAAVVPGAADAGYLGLAAQLALGPDLLCDARHLAGEGVELVDHDVDRVLKLQDLALAFDGDLLAQVAVGDGGGDLGDVPHLAGQVAGHQVDVVGEVLPDPADPLDLRLPAQLALDANFAGDAGH